MRHAVRWHQACSALTWGMQCTDISHALRWHQACIALTWGMHCADIRHAVRWHQAYVVLTSGMRCADVRQVFKLCSICVLYWGKFLVHGKYEWHNSRMKCCLCSVLCFVEVAEYQYSCTKHTVICGSYWIPIFLYKTHSCLWKLLNTNIPVQNIVICGGYWIPIFLYKKNSCLWKLLNTNIPVQNTQLSIEVVCTVDVYWVYVNWSRFVSIFPMHSTADGNTDSWCR
jgi:hypothetical protein